MYIDNGIRIFPNYMGKDCYVFLNNGVLYLSFPI